MPSPNKILDIEKELGNSQNYEDAIMKIFRTRGERGMAYNEAEQGVSYFSTVTGRKELSQSIACAVISGSYRPEPVELWLLESKGRLREAHTAKFTDHVVASVLFKLLLHNARCYGLPGIYSYIPGKSNIEAMRDFAGFVRAHRKPYGSAVPPLHVLQADFARYGDDLPVGPRAKIWQILRETLTFDNGANPLTTATWDLITDLIRPVVRMPDGSEFTRLNGVAMGTALVPLVGNLAVLPLDSMINSVDGTFYARYNDDLIIAHPDLTTLQEIDSKMDELLVDLGVKRNPSKDIRTTLSVSGQTSSADNQYRGCDRIHALGLTVGYSGTICLAPHRQRRFIKDIAARIDAISDGLSSMSAYERAREIVSATNAMLDVTNPFAVSGISAILDTTTDRGALKDLDFRIARKIVQKATLIQGVRGFRSIDPRALRSDMGLVSLVHLRNLR